ncbi:tripartite tricarboxylate transporter substrate binding protein [Mycolicibacterium sediminis]|uniref:C4-dicarboxylate ABC transporter substrate-binding protein n=1 Tax=Mycolicibacterium sediminis TaxID=1286180 RepID=A0A7I7QT06_9MYCO|nr:tripartite tricarboxylate transporter substrate-binding protein [Mycolicibacterium sediminis]BBY29006.1 C4-dicarboxylate ABC transporter substrate-binding protein [Mycolicibacterium sediminis]
MTIRTAIGVAIAALVVATSGTVGEVPNSHADAYPTGPVTMTAGANPGSGFDLTIRSVVDTLQREGLVNVPLPVQNRPGATGADFLATMIDQYRGADDQVSVTSLSMMLNQLRGVSPYGYRDVTMIARLMTEYFVVVVPAGSPFANLTDLMAAIRSDPSRVAVAAAGDDHAPFDLLVAAAGADPASVDYADFEGGGDQTSALRDGRAAVAISGVSEFVDPLKAGDLRALGVLAEDRLPGLDAPTAREQGLDVTLSNWRGLYGPPGMPAVAVAYWQRVLGEMVLTPTWRDIAERSQFTTTFMVGDEFQTFLAETQADVAAAIAEERR